MPSKLKSFVTNVCLLFAGCFLFALSNPGFIFPTGLAFLAWFSYIPVFILINRISLKTSWLYGFFYGVFSYMLYVSWLVIFSPVGSIAIEIQYGVLLMITFFFIKLAYVLAKKWGYLIGFVVFMAYEYLKTTGFAGFSYGVTAYTQWENLVLMQHADITGVWLLSALIVFASSWLSVVIFESKFCIKDFKNWKCLVQSAKNHRISFCVWTLLMAFVIVYGIVSPKDYSNYPKVSVAAIQHNTDPWLGNINTYISDINDLIKLSEEAKKTCPDVKLIVWPETAMVPPIQVHYNKLIDKKRHKLIRDFLNYVENQDAVFVVGNDHRVVIQDDAYAYIDEDYNAVFVFTPKKNTLPPKAPMYKKIHLVPFTESFPWGEQFPYFYNLLLNGDTHLWSQGDEYVVFREAGLTFSTPICFEDTFGETGRQMFNAGARALVNLSNDAWSKSLSCQNQHLAMARFRCIENRIPAVRSTASGQTCIIDPNGVIEAMSEPFEKNFVTGQISVLPEDTKPTVYAKFGDILGKGFAILAVVLIVWEIIKNKLLAKK